jgi:hypothetical protein
MNGRKTFSILQGVIAGICLFIPVFLRLADNANLFRSSISNYVYMVHSYIFGMLLCMAAMLFIFNASVYYREQDRYGLNKHGKWYNIVLGVSLLGVILFPHLQYAAIHYTFAGIFFIGNAAVMAFFHKKKDRVVSIILSILVVTAIALHYLGFVTLLVGEWLSLAAIGTHFILQSVGLMSMDTLTQKP